MVTISRRSFRATVSRSAEDEKTPAAIGPAEVFWLRSSGMSNLAFRQIIQYFSPTGLVFPFKIDFSRHLCFN
jgi:hypothetical protein